MKIKTAIALAAALMIMGAQVHVPAYAAEGGFSVKADEIEYDMKSGDGTAKGNVVILHDGGKATSAAAEFNSKTMTGRLTGGVVADKDDAHITWRNLCNAQRRLCFGSWQRQRDERR